MFGQNIFFLFVFFVSCKDNEEPLKDGTLSPSVVSRGVETQIDLQLNRSFLLQDSFFDLGKGVMIQDTYVIDDQHATIDLYIQPNTSLGTRDVLIISDGKRLNLPSAYSIISESFLIEPNQADIGEMLGIGILGTNTEWTNSELEIDFGQNIEVIEFQVLSDTLAEALIFVQSDVVPGKHDIRLKDQNDNVLILPDGLQIDRETTKISFDPQTISQGDTVSFSIRSVDSNFLENPPTVTFYENFVESNDIQLRNLNIINERKISGQIQISNAATIGHRAIEIESGDEKKHLPYAFEILESPWDPKGVAIDLQMSVERYLDPTTCDLFEEVEAKAVFYIPLQPACDDSIGISNTEVSLDINQFYSSEENISCPTPKSIPAGDTIWLESDQNTISLEKIIHPTTNQISYESPTLTLQDYKLNTPYSLRIDGDNNGVGEEVIPNVLITVPSDWEWIKPDLCQTSISREEDLTIYWTNADTQYYGFLESIISGTSKEDEIDNQSVENPNMNNNLYLHVNPFDDGMHQFSGSLLTQFERGSASLKLQSTFYSPFFGLSDSTIQNNQALSFISYTTPVTFE